MGGAVATGELSAVEDTMQVRRTLSLSAVLCICAALLSAQGLTSTATKDDWEEINFEFNSAILSDGYPSLLRLADLLHANPALQGEPAGQYRLGGITPIQRKAFEAARRDGEGFPGKVRRRRGPDRHRCAGKTGPQGQQPDEGRPVHEPARRDDRDRRPGQDGGRGRGRRCH